MLGFVRKQLNNKLIRFGLLGVVSVSANLVITATLHDLCRVSAEFAYAVALCTVMLMNFFACRHLVFESRSTSIHRQALQFGLGTVLFRGVEYLLFLLIHTWLGLYYLLTIAIVQATVFIGKFLYFSWTAFDTPITPGASPRG